MDIAQVHAVWSLISRLNKAWAHREAPFRQFVNDSIPHARCGSRRLSKGVRCSGLVVALFVWCFVAVDCREFCNASTPHDPLAAF